MANNTLVTPLHWGFDDAGGPAHLETMSWAGDCMREFGFDTWIMHYRPAETVADDAAQIRRVDAWCSANNLQWLGNLEHANYNTKHVDSLGRDWHNRPDGRHYFLFPDDLMRELQHCRSLRALIFDEAEHMQNCYQSVNGIHQHMFYLPEGHSLDEAAGGFTAGCREVVEQYAHYGIRLNTESVFPVLLDCFARAGMTAATKILKENWSPAYYAVALGAAREYDTELWITPDLWGGTGRAQFMNDGYPGHTLDEYRSAMLLAYHLGADAIYTENLAMDRDKRGDGSLIYARPDGYRVTPYGEITRWFRRVYEPEHLRHYRWQDVRPRTAIIHQADGCWGQRNSWLPDTLFGNPDWHSDEVTEGWLRAFHLLSRGVIPPDALSWHNTRLDLAQPYQVFCPLDGVVVYDHLVRPELLQGLEVIFLTGIGISPVTLAGVRQAVQAGATCIGRPVLLPADIREAAQRGPVRDGLGQWLASESFLDDAVRQAVAPVLPKEDELTYCFNKTRVVLRPTDGDPSRLNVTVSTE